MKAAKQSETCRTLAQTGVRFPFARGFPEKTNYPI